MKNRNRVREGSAVATFIMYALAVLVMFITIYPFYYVFIISISDGRHVLLGDIYFYPKGFSLSSYAILVKDSTLWRSFANSVMYVIGTTGLMVITCILGAYPLTFKNLKGRRYINLYLLITMFFSGGLIPSFLLILRLGLYDTPWALILPFSFSVWNIILTKSFFSTVPETLREAARIDGANVYQILWKVYLPLSVPILAVISVYTIVSTWNGWFNALVYLPRLEWQPLQLYLRRILILLQEPAGVLAPEAAEELAARRLSYAQLKYAIIIFTSLPVLFTYPFFQRYFMKGIMLGSLKE
jgi:putative aldouronate transport system permease protein